MLQTGDKSVVGFRIDQRNDSPGDDSKFVEGSIFLLSGNYGQQSDQVVHSQEDLESTLHRSCEEVGIMFGGFAGLRHRLDQHRPD